MRKVWNCIINNKPIENYDCIVKITIENENGYTYDFDPKDIKILEIKEMDY